MKIKNVHIPLSVVCYLACLPLPGYYLSERLEPQMAYHVLMWGWPGPIDGHFSWYANPLYLFALLSADRLQRSSIFGFIALILAVSFVFHKEILISPDSGIHLPITAYGWGYGLWVTSIATLFAGQLLRAKEIEAGRIAISSFFVSGFLLAGYASYYFFGDNSMFSIRTARAREFAARCASSGERIVKKTDDVKGIYFEPDSEWHIVSRQEGDRSLKYIAGEGGLGSPRLNTGQLLFYERSDGGDRNGYLKYVLGDNYGVKTKHLDSEYAVITQYYDIPRYLDISGATVTVKDLRDNSVIATSTFFIDNKSGKFCGNVRGGSPTSEFITEVLGLKKRYPSVFDKAADSG